MGFVFISLGAFYRSVMQFRHERIDSDPPCVKLGFCLTTDLTGNGRDDVIVGGRGGGYRGQKFVKKAKLKGLPTFDTLRKLVGLHETHLFWYENPGWQRHDIAWAPYLDVGGTLGDITGDGRLDVIAGQGINYYDLYWFEQPPDPRDPWKRRLITDDFEKYHDVAVSDVDDDGEPEVVGLSQESAVAFYYDIPENPHQSPWPEEYRHIVAESLQGQGIEILDLDGDGRTELIAGTSVFNRKDVEGTDWEREDIVSGWEGTRVAVADLDGDGDLEVVFSEGDSPHLGTRPGRVGWFDPPEWTPTVLREDLYCPHSLQIADFFDNGRPDIYVGEMGLDENEDPLHLIFVNQGDGTFEEQVITKGIPTHEAKVTDINRDGRPDIVGKSYGPDHHVDVWYNEGE